MHPELKHLIENTHSIIKFESGEIYQCIANKNHVMGKVAIKSMTYPNNVQVIVPAMFNEEDSFEVITCKDVVDIYGYNTPSPSCIFKLDDSADWASMNIKMEEFSKTLINMHKINKGV